MAHHDASITVSYQTDDCIRYEHPDVDIRLTTVGDLKELIGTQFQIEPRNISFYYESTELAFDDHTLFHYLQNFSPEHSSTDELGYEISLINKDPNASQNLNTYLAENSREPMAQFNTGLDVEEIPGNSQPSSSNVDQRGRHGLVGLVNQGATCYLNSLIQVLFMTPEFRRLVYHFPLHTPTEHEQHVKYTEAQKKLKSLADAKKKAAAAAAAAAPASETNGDASNVRPTPRNGNDDPPSENGNDDSTNDQPESKIGKTSDEEIALEDIPDAKPTSFTTYQSLDVAKQPGYLPQLENGNIDFQAVEKVYETSLIYHLKLLFAQLQSENASSVGTENLTKSFGWNNSDSFVQQDVQELARILIDNLEEKSQGLDIPGLGIQDMFRGKLLHYVECTVCGYQSKREQNFFDISVVIKEKKNILEAFAEFTIDEILDGDNKYFCEDCNTKQVAKKGCKIKQLPTILMAHLQRFDFNYTTFQRYKLNSEIRFPNILQLDAFQLKIPEISADPETWLNTIPETEDEEDEDDIYLRSVSIDDNVSESNDSNASYSSASPSKNSKKKPKGQVVIGTSDQVYELYAILVHNGGVSFGHYYAYIKNFADGKWYKFNDSYVSEVTEAEVIASTQGTPASSHSHAYDSSANAYMLVYKKTPVTPICEYIPGVGDKLRDGSIRSSVVENKIESSEPAPLQFSPNTPPLDMYRESIKSTPLPWGPGPISDAFATVSDDDDESRLVHNYTEEVKEKALQNQISTGKGPHAINNHLDNGVYKLTDNARDLFSTLPDDRKPENPKLYKLYVENILEKPVTLDEIPPLILERLNQRQTEEINARAAHKLAQNQINVEVYRDKTSLKPIVFHDIHQDTTGEQLLANIIKEIQSRPDETDYDAGYRLRVISHRRNRTLRPAKPITSEELKKTLLSLGLHTKKYIYLQQGYPNNPLPSESDSDTQLFLTLRWWNPDKYAAEKGAANQNSISKVVPKKKGDDSNLSIAEQAAAVAGNTDTLVTEPRPCGIMDIVNITVPSSISLKELKQLVITNKWLDWNLDDIVVFEEETEQRINFLVDNNKTLEDYGLIIGDILHFEKIVPGFHYDINDKTKKIVKSQVQEFFVDKNDEVLFTINETKNSFRSRQKHVGMMDNLKLLSHGDDFETFFNDMDEKAKSLPQEYRNEKISLKYKTSKSYSMATIRKSVADFIQIDPLYMRLSLVDYHGVGEPRIIRNSPEPISVLMESVLSKDAEYKLKIDILSEPEILLKSDKIVTVQYHNSRGDHLGTFEISIQKSKTIWDLKTALFELTGVAEKYQCLSEWFKGHFFRFFTNNNTLIKKSQIRIGDILRMDEIPDDTVNALETDETDLEYIPIQLARFNHWVSTAYGEREMKTLDPVVFLVKKNQRLSWVQYQISKMYNCPLEFLNLAVCNTYPVYESRLSFLREKSPQVVVDPSGGVADGVDDETPLQENPAESGDLDENGTQDLLPEVPPQPEVEEKDSLRLGTHIMSKLYVFCWDDKRQTPEERSELQNLFEFGNTTSSSHSSSSSHHRKREKGVKIYT